MATRQITFHYREAQFEDFLSAPTLQIALSDILFRLRPYQRTQELGAFESDEDAADTEKQAVVLRLNHKGMVCGVMQRYDEASVVPASLQSDEDDNFEMKLLALPNVGKRRAKLATKLLYFGVRDNHVLICQSRSFDIPRACSHLRYLLGKIDRNNGHETSPSLELRVGLPPKLASRRPVKVSAIRIETQPEAVPVQVPQASAVAPAADEAGKEQQVHQEWTLSSDPLVETIVNYISRHKKTPGPPAQLREAFRHGQLTARVELSYAVERKAETSPLDALAGDLTDTERVKWEIGLPHGETMRPDAAKQPYSRDYSVEVNGPFLMHRSVFDRMVQMLDNLVETKAVVPDP